MSESHSENGGTSRRIQKVERELRELISAYLIQGFKRSLPGLVSIPHVRAAGDLKSAKVYVSLIGMNDNDIHDECVEILNEYAFDVQKHLSNKLSMKFCPKLRFYSDELQQAALKVDRQIEENAREMRENEEKRAAASSAGEENN